MAAEIHFIGISPTQFNHVVDTEGLRTLDLLTASQAFYQLNYWPITFPDVFSCILSQDHFRSTTTCKSDSLFARGEVVGPPSSVNALINTLRSFVELADGIL